MKPLVWTVVMLTVLTSTEVASGTRAKRFFGNRPGSAFFLRMNFKDIILPTTNIFAHVAGFKVTWPVPERSVFSKKRVIRSLYEDIEFLFDRHGFDGKSCLLDNVCQAAEYVTRNNGVMGKIVKLFLRNSSYGNESSLLDTLNCNEYRNECPLEFIGADVLLEQ